MSAQRVIAFLAIRSHPMLRLHVAGSLWLDSPEERGFANLRSALWRIHRSGLAVVDSSGGTLRLAAGVRVDLHEATALAHRLIGSVPMGAGGDVDWLPLAGEVLPDWDDDWALVEREHFRNLSLQALESLVRAPDGAGPPAPGARGRAGRVRPRAAPRERAPPARADLSGRREPVRRDPPVPAVPRPGAKQARDRAVVADARARPRAAPRRRRGQRRPDCRRLNAACRIAGR